MRTVRFVVHKLPGIVCLIHYFYRIWRLVTLGGMGFRHLSQMNLLLIACIQATLSAPGLLFSTLPKSRMKQGRLIM